MYKRLAQVWKYLSTIPVANPLWSSAAHQKLATKEASVIPLWLNNCVKPDCNKPTPPFPLMNGLPRERKIPGSNPACAGIFSGSSDLKIGSPVATLPGAWRYRVSAWTGRPGVSILWLGEMESWICNFCLSVAARKIVWADLFLRYTRMLLGR